ncbi:hypothetical protein ACFLXQ_09235 [Chloroflexota bacterium]
MPDIKLTLSKDTKFHAPSEAEEAARMRQEGELVYPLPSKPTKALPGCMVYFIRDGQLVARARAKDFINASQIQQGLYSYTGEPTEVTDWNVVCEDMELAAQPIAHPGFQGFQYVTQAEQEQFEDAFTK